MYCINKTARKHHQVSTIQISLWSLTLGAKWEGDNVWFWTPTGPAENQHMRVVRVRETSSGNAPTSGELTYLQEHLTYFNNVLWQDNDDYLDYIDLDSWVDYWLVNILFLNYSPHYQLHSIFFYLKDGIIHMGPVWDFDESALHSGIAGGAGNNRPYNWTPEYLPIHLHAPWLVIALEKESFRLAFKARWNEIVGVEVAAMLLRQESLKEDLAQAIIHENLRWERQYRFLCFTTEQEITGTWQQNIDYIFEFLRLRSEFLADHFNSASFLNPH